MLAILFALAFMITMLSAPRAYAAVDEQEPNDEFGQANEMPLNEMVYGEASENFNTLFSDCADEDYYKATLPNAGSVTLTFVNDRYEKSMYNADKFYVYVYNQYFEQVGQYNYTTRSTRPESTTMSLSKGAYYIHIYCNRYGEPNHPYHFKLAYNIPGTSIAKITPAKKKFTVKWAKKSGAHQYQIRYSAKKSMTGAKTVNVSNKAKSKTIKAKSKKNYYVQVRVAKKIGDQVYWSKWSGKKKVKTK